MQLEILSSFLWNEGICINTECSTKGYVSSIQERTIDKVQPGVQIIFTGRNVGQKSMEEFFNTEKELKWWKKSSLSTTISE